jgi:hypothetical protein
MHPQRVEGIDFSEFRVFRGRSPSVGENDPKTAVV